MKNMGKDQGGKASKGYANIEFEVRLILDIMKGYGSEYMDELKGSRLLTKDELVSIEDGYDKFIKSFRGADGKLLNPQAMNQTGFMADYDRFLGYYATKSENYRSEVDRTMKPKALIELLKNIRNNC